MKIKKNKTEYTLYKGMGDVIIGQIIDYNDFRCAFVAKKDLSFGLESEDLKFIYEEMMRLESKYKKKKKEDAVDMKDDEVKKC